MKIQTIIPTAGSGVRFESTTPKSLVDLGGKPLFVHCLQTIEQCSLIESVILVVPEELREQFSDIVQSQGLSKVQKIVPGGATRSDSVFEGIKALDDDTDVVVIHDGARPLANEKVFEDTINAIKEHDAVVAGLPIKPTVKKINPQTNNIVETLDRTILWEAQTPQVFKKDVLLKAHEGRGDDATDDAVLVEKLGVEVKMILGDEKNIKITTQEDFVIAEALLCPTK